MQSPKSENNRYNIALKESNKFLRSSNERLYKMKQIKDNLEINNEQMKNGYYQSRIFRKQKEVPNHPLNSLEQTFKQHISSFRSYFNSTNISKHDILLRTRTEVSMHQKQQQLGTLLQEAKEVCEDIIPEITSMKREQKKSRIQWKGMQKDFQRDMSTESWQSDRQFNIVKDKLRKMQEDDLPGYFKFCLINSKDNLKNMRRANQEIKETRFLWYQLQKAKKDGNIADNSKYTDQNVQEMLQGILKRFQRIKTNQFIQKGGKDSIWKLKSEKSELRNRDKEDYQMIVENLGIKKKDVTTAQDLKAKFERFEKDLKEDAERKKNIEDKQINQQINHIIQRSNDRIFKMNQTSVKSIKSEESEYLRNISITKELQEKNLQSIDQIKNQLESAKIQIKKKHVDNYSHNELPIFLKKVFANTRR